MAISSTPHTSQNSQEDTKILIADDDDAMRYLLREALMQWGYFVIEAKNGEEAWEAIHQPDPPHILILDWKMPKLDGITLSQRIRKELDFYPYIIFLTQVSGAENIIKGFDAGANEFLMKPVNFPELHNRIISGEKIIEFVKIIEEQNHVLNSCVSYIKTLEQLILLLRKMKS